MSKGKVKAMYTAARNVCLVMACYLVLFSKSYALNPCPEFQNTGDTPTVMMNQNILIPEGKPLILNSTLRVSEDERICINRTVDKDEHSMLVECTRPVPQEIKFVNTTLTTRNGSLVLIIDGVSRKETCLYTWWSETRGWLGDNLVTTYNLQDDERHVEVFTRKDQTFLITFYMPMTGSFTDVALTHNHNDVYNYQLQDGRVQHCQSYQQNVIPTYTAPYAFTIIENMTCGMEGHYNFKATEGFRKVQKIIAKIHIKESTTLHLKILNNTISHASIECETTGTAKDITWKFEGNPIKNSIDYKLETNERTSVLSVLRSSSSCGGQYSCEVQLDCGITKTRTVYLPSVDRIEGGVSYHGQTARLICSITAHIRSAKWVFRKNVLENGDKYRISNTTSMVLELDIRDLTLDDNGQYLCSVTTRSNNILQTNVNVKFAGPLNDDEMTTSIIKTKHVKIVTEGRSAGTLPKPIPILMVISMYFVLW